MKKKFDKKAIGSAVHQKIAECSTGRSSGLSSERIKLMKYYNGELPARENNGRSSFVSRDVFDGVSRMKAQLTETFSGGTDIVRFTATGPEDVTPARLSTAYCSHWFWQRNNGEQVIRSLVHDGLMARAGIVKVFWEPKTEEVEQAVPPMPAELATMMVDDAEVLEASLEIDPELGIATGTLTREVKTGKIVVQPIPPEEFGIDPEGNDLTAFHYHRTPLTASEIKSRWPKSAKLLKGIAPDAQNSVSTENSEAQARQSQIDAGYRSDSRDGILPDDQRYWVYECYFTTTNPNGGSDCLVQAIMVGNQCIAVQEIDRSPIKYFVPLRLPHQFYGDSYARLLADSQISRTALIRAVLDHAAVTTNPRYLVGKGSGVEPRELLENRLGGIVNTAMMDGVMPLPQSPLNPFIFQTQEMIRNAAEQTTGVSALSVGNDKAVISNQNSAAMIDQQVGLAQIQQRVPARELADTLREIFIEINQLAVEHCDRKDWIDVAGEWVEMDPQQLKERKTAQVTMHLSPGDREQAAMKKISFFTQARLDPVIGSMITPDNAYRFAMEAAEGADIKDVANYITHPSKIPPKGPDPVAMKKLELEERKIAASEAQAKAMLDKVAAEYEVKMAKLELEVMRLERDAAMRERDALRKEAETANRIDVAQREMAAAESAPLMDPSKPIISPN